jgi:steroid 5-alpha reductase family enzyme
MSLSPLAPVSDARAPQQTSTQLSLSPEVWTNFLPPVMGFMKSEWTVSYGYGFATSLSALSLLKRTPLTPDNPIFALQAASLIFYGLRLNVHLFVRNRISTRMQEFQKKMEERAEERGSRWKRAPIVLSCGFLYYALYMPLLLASKVSASNPVPSITMKVMKALVAAQWLGFVMGAVADATKTYVKKTKGEKTLVTSGIFSLLRHPNYTGEIIAWSCNALLGALAGAYVLGDMAHKIGLLGITFVGWVGITFVLLAATRSLEERQKKDYGDKEDYKKWVDSTWSGWYLPKNEKDTALLEVPEITLDDETEEESGSGI